MPYSVRQAYESGAFLQRNLISQDKLASEARKRGINVPTTTSTVRPFFEELDAQGAFCPLAFTDREPYQDSISRQLAGPQALVFRDEIDFRPWSEFSWEEVEPHYRDRKVIALYSPWQLTYLDRALTSRSFVVQAAELADPSDAKKLMEIAIGRAQARLRTLGEHDADWRPLLLLLIRIQNRYWPYVGTYTMPIDPKTHQYVDPLPAERRRFRAKRTLAEQGLVIDDVRSLYERLAFFIQNDDPLPYWWVLRRLASRHERSQLKGAARRVEDMWEAAQILRLFYRTLTRRTLPDCNAVGTHPEWQERVLGRRPRMYYDQSDLLRFLIRHDLYPHQVHLFVEGHSEEALLPPLIETQVGSLPEAGIQLTNLRGIDNVSLRHRELVDGFSNYARTAVLIADNEGEIAKYVKGLVAEGLMHPDGILLWERNLEEDNFSDAELVRAVETLARARGARLRGLSGKAVRESFERRRNLPMGAPVTFMDELKRLARNPSHGSIRFSKPELARELATLILDELTSKRDWTLVSKRRPILERVSVIVQLARGARFAPHPEQASGS